MNLKDLDIQRLLDLSEVMVESVKTSSSLL